MGKVEKNSIHNSNYKKTTHLLFMDMEQKKNGSGKGFFFGKGFWEGGLGRTKCHIRTIVGIKFDTYALSGVGKVLYLGKVFGGWAW